MKTKAEILQETVEYYSEDINRRAVGGNEVCLYTTADNRHCAVGRCLTEEAIDTVQDFEGDVEDLVDEYAEDNIDNILKEQYKGHEEKFWADLQTLHDKESNWDKTGLTEEGQDYIEYLKSKWGC